MKKVKVVFVGLFFCLILWGTTFSLPFTPQFLFLKADVENPNSSLQILAIDQHNSYLAIDQRVLRIPLAGSTARFPDSERFFDGIVNDMKLNNGHLYVVTQAGEFVIVDPASFTEVGRLSASSRYTGVAIQGNLAYLTSLDGLQVVDVADKKRPFLINTIPADTFSIIASDATRLIGTNLGDLEFYSLADPTAPQLIKSYTPPDDITLDAFLQGPHLFLFTYETTGCGFGGCLVYNNWHQLNIADLNEPILEASTELEQLAGNGVSAVRKGNNLLFSRGNDTAVIVYNTNNLQQPSFQSSISINQPGGILKGSATHLASYTSAHGLSIYAYLQPLDLQFKGTYDNSLGRSDEVAFGNNFILSRNLTELKAVRPKANGSFTVLFDFANLDIYETRGVLAEGNLVYLITKDLTTEDKLLQIYDMSNPSQPMLLSSTILPLPQGSDHQAKLLLDANMLYVLWFSTVFSNTGLTSVDVADKSMPSSFDYVAIDKEFDQVGYYNNTIYFNGFDMTDGRNLYALDVSNPAAVSEQTTAVTLTQDPPLTIEGNRAYIGTENGFDIYDLTMPLVPQFDQSVDLGDGIEAIEATATTLYTLMDNLVEIRLLDSATFAETAVWHSPILLDAPKIFPNDAQFIVLSLSGLYLFDQYETAHTLYLPVVQHNVFTE